MSYGVNKWESQNTRARSAARRKKSARRTAKKSARPSARRAPKKRATKKRAAPKKRPQKKPRAKKRAAPKAKKERLYTRYDPETGQKVRVTKDTFEYEEWPSRKPSKKKIQRESLKRDPVGTVGQVAVTAGKRSAERIVERSARDVLRATGASGALATAGAVARTAVRAVAVPAAAAGIGLSLAISLGEALKGQARVRTGDAINKLSRQFVANQAALMRVTGARSWDGVPKEARDRLLRDYRSAVATAAAQGGFTRSVEGYK